MWPRILTLCLVVVTTPVWADFSSSLTTGIDFSRGKYGGTTSTDILYIPVTAKFQSDDLFFKLTLPYISVTGAGGGVVRGMGPFKITTGTKVTTQSGLGDVIASAGYTVVDTYSFILDLVGNIKFGTADASRSLGTGENDYSAQLDGFYITGNTTLFATTGYKIIGAPAGVVVNNIAYGTLGFSQQTKDSSSVGVALDAAQSSSTLNSGTRELSVFISNKVDKNTKIKVSFLKGFSDASPDYGASLMFTGTY